MLTIFANLKIDTPIKIQHLKDSFFSFNTISDNWLINVRGKQREEALSFLRQELGEKMIEFSLLDDAKGWSANALQMIKSAKYNYLLIWNEDHLNIAPQDVYEKIIKEMNLAKVEYLGISFFKNNIALKEIPFDHYQYIDYVFMTGANWARAINNEDGGYKPFLLSLSGIYDKRLFQKLLLEDYIDFSALFRKKIRQSLLFIARCLFLKKILRRYYKKVAVAVNNSAKLYSVPEFSIKTPFNLERNQYRTELLPLRYAIPRQELFACIDDDNAVPGSSLISQGLYNSDLTTKNN
jgi:hypothetical protein